MPSNVDPEDIGAAFGQEAASLAKEVAQLEKEEGQLELRVARLREESNRANLPVADALRLWHQNRLSDAELERARAEAMPSARQAGEAEMLLSSVRSKLKDAREKLDKLKRQSSSR